jgi:hypothetical protein
MAEQEPVAAVTGYFGGHCVIAPMNPAAVFPANMALYAAPPAPQTDDTALSRYRANTDGCEPDTPKERLRAFCSVAMAGQDWLDAESFFDALPDDTALLRQALTLLIRYRNGTPIGHQPHMTAHEADDAIAALRARLDGAPQPDDTTLLRQARLPEGEKK